MEGLRLLVTKSADDVVQPDQAPGHRAARRAAPPASTATSTATPTARSSWTPARGRRCARVRLDTPTLRGNHANADVQPRSARSARTDHFAEVEEYFDGDISLQPQIGGRAARQRLDEPHGRLQLHHRLPAGAEARSVRQTDPAKATAARAARRGAVPRQGPLRRVPSARPFYTDNQMHDLRVEEFYRRPGRGLDQDLPPARHQGLARRTSTTAACRRWKTLSSSSTSSSM